MTCVCVLFLVLRQRVLMNLANRPAHIHGAIEERLPADVREQISKLMPPQIGKRDMRSDELVMYKKAYSKIQDVIFEHFASTRGAGRPSYCHVHRTECMTFTQHDGSELPGDIRGILGQLIICLRLSLTHALMMHV